MRTKHYEPYIVPCPDYRAAPPESPDIKYALSIPFMQFPLLTHGRPMTDANLDIEGVKYYGLDNPHSMIYHYRRIGDNHRANPGGPYTYSEWSAIPDDPDEPERWARYLALYKPMTEEGSVVHIEVTDGSILSGKLPDDVILSVFTNERLYCVISNLSDKPYGAVFADEWTDREALVTAKEFTIELRKIMFFGK